MGQERPASWHDRQIRTTKRHKKNWDELPCADLIEEVARLVPADARVVDVGCGCGHMAAILKERGVTTDYLGFDFASVAIDAAQKRAPWAWFVNIDVRKVTFPRADIFLFVDVLDNIWDDVEVVNSVPNGSQIVITVPTTDAPARVAHFPSLDDATRRYRDVMNIEKAYTFQDKRQILVGTV